jgi:DNA mismatch repair protein MutL
MLKISRLPSDLANQIAAGEVVERPASVVKELVENALDAGAGRIGIHIELGGKKLVRVEDDGEGMLPDDARLALERHATSKIRRAEDLGAIVTLGFRGEALPSIASVARFMLRTRFRGAESGTEIRVNGGTVFSVSEVAAVEGTVIEVADLFYNLPARRKFLKSDTAESSQVTRLTTQLALAYPEVGFRLTSGARTVLECPPAGSLRDRLYQLYGERNDLIEVAKDAGGVRISGYAAALAELGPTKGAQHLFVNHRIVRDRTIAHAVVDAYSVASIKERSPEVHLFLDMAPDMVDVNVHPTKAEVRFRNQSLVHEVVRRALLDALGGSGAPELRLDREMVSSEPVAVSLPDVLGGGSFPSRWIPDVRDTPPPAAQASASRPPNIRRMMPLGQFRDTFIVAVDDEGIAIVDQHVAHERVLFERVMEALSTDRLESQRLLVPVLVDLPPAAHQVLLARLAEIERFGYELEEFGENTVKVTAVPAVLETSDSSNALRALAEDLEGLDRGSDVQSALRRIAATTACHAAVKANYPLTQEKMTYILEGLRATAYSTVCPHGRPVMLRLTRREIEKNFDRI